MYKDFTLKPEDVTVLAVGSGNEHFYLNNEGKGYRLILSSDHTVCLVKKDIFKKEEILVDEKDLTMDQLRNAYDIFKRANDRFMRMTKVRSKFKELNIER